ncbi:uncharacterized protein LOC123441812 [Hordeum vulgare subsp. vulgare]|uniref:uncharacterized protein LOC123441812 n=1 Tax=Hordeum vulgare subsp. vulgare TaxID=112509 RepID=UPI001D1A48CA|nr:uncharacterized protein LOC123441812 [Hordeum vulgare subsp. vulgare]
MDDNISFHKEKSFRRGASYVVTMVAEFDEYTNDWLYLHEGTVLPKPSCWKRKSSDSVEFSVWPNVSVRGGEHPGSSSEAPAMLVPTLVPARSVREAIQEVKMVQIWENVMKSCEQRGRDLLNLNVITSVDLTEWLRTKDSGNETINLGLSSYDMLCTVLHSIKAGSTGLLLGNGVEVDQQNRPRDLLLDWFFHPVLVLKDQMQVLKMTEQEVRFLERSTLFVGSSSATAGADVWDNGAETPRDPVRMAQIQAISKRMVGIVRSMSKFPTYRRRYRHVVKLMVAYSVEREGSFGSSASGPSASFEITRRRVVWLRHFQTFKEKYSALNQNTGVNRSLTEMIRKYHYPGQRMAKITCLYDPTVMELMWGIQICMPILFPEEDAYLTEDDCVPISQGLQNVLSRYDCNYVNSEMVNERIVTMAYILHECDTFEKEKSRDLHRAAAVIKNVSGIDTEGWGLWKIATAVMKIWCVEEAHNSCEISEDEVSRLRNDADKYEVKLDKDACLKVSRQMLKVLFFRTRKKGLLEYFVEHAKEAYEAE